MNDTPPINRSVIIKFVLGLLLALGLFYAFTHSLLVIEASGAEEKSIYVEWGKEPNQQKTFTLKQGSKTFFVPSSAYKIEVSAGEKYTRYDKSAGRLSRQVVPVEVEQQRKSAALGVSSYGCAVSKNLGQDVTYYPCFPSGGSVLAIKSGATVQTKNLGGLAPDNETSEGTSSVLKPYRGGFIEAAAQGGVLYLRERSFTGEEVSKPVKINRFGGRIDDSTFATINDVKTETISILNRETEELWLLDNSTDSSPRKVNLKSQLSKLNDVQVVQVVASDNAVYVVVSRDPGALETHDGSGETIDPLQQNVEEANKNQKIIVVNPVRATVEDEYELPSTLTIRLLSGNPAGDLLFVPHFAEKPESYLFTGGSLKKLSFSANDIQDVCWRDNDNIYYSSGDQNQIFRYSLSRQAAFLVYENPGAAIGKLSCTFGEVGFTLEREDDGIVDEQVHYQLTNIPLSGGRLESVLPTYLTVDGTVLKASQEQLAVRLDVIVGAPPTKERARQEFIKYLKGQAVKTEGLVFNTAF